MAPETLPGTPVPNRFRVDRAVMSALDRAVVDSRVQFGKNGRNVNAPFRASELGNIVAAIDQDGKPSGCPRKVFYSFFPSFKATEIDAATAHNFARGDLEEAHAATLLDKAGLLAEKHVNLGAWDPENKNPRWRADPRFPDRSGGRVRGDVDFVINHPEVGVIPLDWKSSSNYAFNPMFVVGGKPDNVVQVMWYAYEMRASHFALGYVNKENGALCTLLYEADHEWVERVLFPACDRMRKYLHNAEVPPRPEGTKPMLSLYEGTWPCGVFAPKKKRVMACAYHEVCHGVPPPTAPPATKKIARKKKASTPPEKPGDIHFG